MAWPPVWAVYLRIDRGWRAGTHVEHRIQVLVDLRAIHVARGILVEHVEVCLDRRDLVRLSGRHEGEEAGDSELVHG